MCFQTCRPLFFFADPGPCFLLKLRSKTAARDITDAAGAGVKPQIHVHTRVQLQIHDHTAFYLANIYIYIYTHVQICSHMYTWASGFTLATLRWNGSFLPSGVAALAGPWSDQQRNFRRTTFRQNNHATAHVPIPQTPMCAHTAFGGCAPVIYFSYATVALARKTYDLERISEHSTTAWVGSRGSGSERKSDFSSAWADYIARP